MDRSNKQTGKVGNVRSMLVPTLLGFFVAFCLLSTSSIGQQSFRPELNQRLKTLGVQPDSQGLRAFFASYSPDASSSQRVAQLIQQLGSDSFDKRTAATNELANINLTDLPLVQKAVDSEDLEISLRARQVIRMFEKGTHLKRLSQVLQLMAENEVEGFLEELCTAFQVVRPTSLLKLQFEKTIAQTVSASGFDVLREHASNTKLHSRDIYVRILSKKQLTKNIDLFGDLAKNDEDVDVVLAAATALAQVPDRRCLEPLIKLLDSQSIRVRSRANQVLRLVTGQRLGFVAVADEEVRQKAIAKWTDWFEVSGKDIELLKDAFRNRILANRLVVSSYSQKKVFETDLDGNVIRSFTNFSAPMGVYGSPDGTILVCDYTGKQVLLFDSIGNIVFRKKVSSGPLGGEILENGNVLVGVSSSRKVVEFDRDGNEVWTAKLPSRVNVVQRTPEGTTVVSMLSKGKIVELNETGKTVFELEVHKPNGVRKLENGNFLVCLYDKGEVREYDPDRNVVWTAQGLTKPARAQRLPDGNTIIYHRQGVVVYGPDGKKVRTIKIKELKSGDVGSLHFF